MACVIKCEKCGDIVITTDDLHPHICMTGRVISEPSLSESRDWVDECSDYLDKIRAAEKGIGIDEIIRGSPPQQSARYNSGKTQVREIDPDFILGLGEVLTASRQKYAEGNWMKETKFSTPYESCMRHLMKFWNGEEIDEETKCHHLLHAATNLMFLYYHTNSGKGIDDRLFKKDKK